MSKSDPVTSSHNTMYLFGMLDSTINSFGPVVESLSQEAFFRSISQFIAFNPDSSVALFPEDFRLFRLGSIDRFTGYITSDVEFLCTAHALPRLAVVSDTGAKQPQELSDDPVSKKA